MGRLSIRPRPLDIHKKLQIVKSVKEFEDDEVTTSLTRHSQILRLTSEAETEVNHARIKKLACEIPTPQFVVVDTYERDYSQSFSQPTSYLRGRGARADIAEFVEYDLDNEDEDWLERFNNEKQILTPDKFEAILFKLEVLDHKARERAGAMTRTLGSPIPVLLQLDSAAEALQSLNVRYIALLPVYNYWKEKRERWQKPLLRRLQPRPPVHDTNPYNVFRPREKTHRAHTRRMQRRENNIQSFEKLRQVRRNFDQAKMVLETLIKREEKKRELVENEVDLQRIQLKYQNEVQLVEDGLPLPGFSLFSGRFGEEDDYADSDDMRNCDRPWARPAMPYGTTLADSKLIIVPAGCMKQDLKQHTLTNGWLLKEDPNEQVLLFTKPLLPERLAAAGIVPPLNPARANGTVYPPYNFRGRIGRGGRIIFDRWNPLLRTQICQTSNP